MEITANLKQYRFDNLDRPLGYIAKAIAVDCRANIRRQVTDRGTMIKLADRTIANKKKVNSVYPERALYRTGQMAKAIEGWRVRKNEWNYGIKKHSKSAEKALIHMFEGVRSKAKGQLITRPFLFISNRRRKLANERMNKYIKNVILKRAPMKRIKVF